MSFIVVAVDGPTGVGKSTVVQLLAERKALLYIDTGAMYRCLALRWKSRGTPNEINVLQDLGYTTQIEFTPDRKVFCDGEDVTEVIRTEEISMLASQISKFSVIREAMKMQQRQLVENAKKNGYYQGAVLEGRDIGTVVLPEADCKFFVDAVPEIRAKRRYEQLIAKGQPAVYKEVLTSLTERDQRDRNREEAPLKAAKDAIILDTGQLSIEEVVEEMVSIIESKQSLNKGSG